MRITNEIRRLNKEYVVIEDERKRYTVDDLIRKIAFSKIAYQDCEKSIKAEGTESVTINATQTFIKSNPAVATHQKYMELHEKLSIRLESYLPPKITEAGERDALTELRDGLV